MGLYSKVKAKHQAPQTAVGGLLRRTIGARGKNEPAVTPAAPQPQGQPVTHPEPQAPISLAPLAPEPFAGRSRTEQLASALARVEAGLDACPRLFEALVQTLDLKVAVLYVADYGRASLVPCASLGLSAAARPMTGGIERLFETDVLRPMGADGAALLGHIDNALVIKPYLNGDSPVGMLALKHPDVPHDALAAALAQAEIASLLRSSSQQIGQFAPVILESLEGVRPAGSTMLISVSCAAVAAAIAARAALIDPAWISDALQRIVAHLLAPLGKVGARADSPIALLTPKAVDTALLAHQTSLQLSRYLRSVRPLPALAVTTLS